jgi:hypothetical protein
MTPLERRLRKLEGIALQESREIVELMADSRLAQTSDRVIEQWHAENPGRQDSVDFIVMAIVDHVAPSIERSQTAEAILSRTDGASGPLYCPTGLASNHSATARAGVISSWGTYRPADA